MPRPKGEFWPPAEVVSDPDILGGWPVVKGTRVPAETILVCLRDGMSRSEIFLHYPSLPGDGIDAVLRWDEERKRAAE
jgi:uncharacterized protein (DUF433 family)